MSHSKIRKAFNDIVRAYGVTKGWKVILENSPDTPVLGQPYLKTYLIPASSVTGTLGGDHKSYVGVYQVTLVFPAGEGTGRVTTTVDELQALFPVYGRVNYDASQVVIMTPITTLPGITQDASYITPVSFTYRSDIN